MRVHWLELLGFRSYQELRWQPDPGVNLLSGPNGAGKTNLLEAIAYLATLRSFRGVGDEGLVADEDQQGYVRAAITKDADGEALVEIEIARQGPRRVQVNKQRLRRASDLADVVLVVTFLPEDLDIVKRGPARRRDVLDEAVVQARPTAATDFLEYDRALRQRNAALRYGQPDPVTLAVWEERLSQAGGKVMARRSWILDRLAPHITSAYRAISESGAELSFDYVSDWGATLDPGILAADHSGTLAAALEDRRRHDIERRVTTAGPHRDDPRLLLEGHDIRAHGSQGEQRTAALALRLATHRVVGELSSTSPLLLLDDVFSELDPARAGALAASLPAAQTFITSARPESVPVAGRSWSVGDGTLQEEDA